MKRKVLITGASGQDGYYLINLLRQHGCVVHAQSRREMHSKAHLDGAQWHAGDLTDRDFLGGLISSIMPDEIYNLAAISRPVQSWDAPGETADLNALVPQDICELLLKHKPDCRLFQASSSEIFGDAPGHAQNEQTLCVPKSPYGAAKLYAHRIVGAYRAKYGLHVSCGILFNHESPKRPLSFVSQKIAFAAAAVSLGLSETPEADERGLPILQDGKIALGDLSVRRDFGFAGDYVEAMRLIVQHPVADDYVIGTGEDHSIEDFCSQAFRLVGRKWTDHVVFDAGLMRKIDSRYTRADATKIQTVLNWRPKIDFQSLVSMMVNAQIAFIKNSMSLNRNPGSDYYSAEC
ncbi:MAG: GDP-mannose 4,6-dehydratase [Candidatus Afipia apatlaquensis]|uniref:GDP-mannose 4,6-dehydratase n=1 Tax=Candidatus Afipia apatlaquensis TaxID=2712852 RepID=A0A7C9VIR9_9BRAD|nr:GDP-mannose 4,6-dehydratase [Candidatus Afipia apatlaquensis]